MRRSVLESIGDLEYSRHSMAIVRAVIGLGQSLKCTMTLDFANFRSWN